jgi:hypothetical protein
MTTVMTMTTNMTTLVVHAVRSPLHPLLRECKIVVAVIPKLPLPN